MPSTTEHIERLVRLEQKLEHVVETVDKLAARQAEIYDAMLQARGAAWLGRWLVPGLTGLIGFAASHLGMFTHIPIQLPH